MNPLTILKAFLVFTGASCGAVAINDYYSKATRANCGVLAAGSGALLAYILKPQGSTKDPETPAGTPADPLSTKEVR